MSEPDFEFFHREWLSADESLDTNTLQRLKNMVRALHYRGGVATVPDHLTEQVAYSSYHPSCIWLRPFWIQPGTQKLLLHVNGTVNGNVTLYFGQGIGPTYANVSSASQTLIGKDIQQLSANGAQNITTFEIDWGLEVEAPTFTLLQLWMTSDLKSNTFSSQNNVPQTARYKSYWGMTDDHNQINGDPHLVVTFYDGPSGTGNVLYTGDIIDTGETRNTYDYWDLNPAFTNASGLGVLSYAVQGIGSYQPLDITLEVVGETTEDLYLPRQHEIAAGADPLAIVMDKLYTQVGDYLRKPRPLTFDVPRQQNENTTTDANVDHIRLVNKNTGGSYGYWEAYIPFHVLTPEHSELNVELLIGSVSQYNNRQEAPILVEAEVMEWYFDVTTGPQSLTTPVTDSKQLDLPVTSRLEEGQNSYQRRLLSDKGRRWSVEDLNDLATGNNMYTRVGLKLTGIPEPPYYVDKGLSYNGSPYVLRLRVEIDQGPRDIYAAGAVLVNALPYLWATAPLEGEFTPVNQTYQIGGFGWGNAYRLTAAAAFEKLFGLTGNINLQADLAGTFSVIAAAPSVRATANSTDLTSITIPASTQEGDMIVLMTFTASATANIENDLESKFDQDQWAILYRTNAASPDHNIGFAMFMKEATAADAGRTIQLAMNGAGEISDDWSAIVVIENTNTALYPYGTRVDLDTAQGATEPNPTSVTAPWGAEANLWIAAGLSDYQSPTWGAPTNFTLEESYGTSLTNGVSAAVASDQNTVATYDPGEFSDGAGTPSDGAALNSVFAPVATWDTPSKIWGSQLKAHWDMSDTNNLWQDRAGTTQATANGATVKRVDDLSGNGYHALEALWTPRDLGNKLFAWWDPSFEYFVLEDGTPNITDIIDRGPYGRSLTKSGPTASIPLTTMDGLDAVDQEGIAQYLIYSTNDLPSDATVACVFDAGTDSTFILATSNLASDYIMAAEDTSTSTTLDSGVGGSVTYRFNGSAFAGTDRDDIHTDAVGKTIVVADTVNLSGWGNFRPFGYGSGWELTGSWGDFVIGIGLTSGEIEMLEGYMAHKWNRTADLPGGHPYKTNPPYRASPTLDTTGFAGGNAIEFGGVTWLDVEDGPAFGFTEDTPVIVFFAWECEGGGVGFGTSSGELDLHAQYKDASGQPGRGVLSAGPFGSAADLTHPGGNTWQVGAVVFDGTNALLYPGTRATSYTATLTSSAIAANDLIRLGGSEQRQIGFSGRIAEVILVEASAAYTLRTAEIFATLELLRRKYDSYIPYQPWVYVDVGNDRGEWGATFVGLDLRDNLQQSVLTNDAWANSGVDRTRNGWYFGSSTSRYLSLANADDNFEINDTNGMNIEQATVLCWVYDLDDATSNAIVWWHDAGGNNDDGFSIVTDGAGNIEVSLGDGTTAYQDTAAYTGGQWSLVGFQIDFVGETIEAIGDGNLSGSATSITGYGTVTPATMTGYLGNDSNTNNAFDGFIESMMWYPYELTTAQIQAIEDRGPNLAKFTEFPDFPDATIWDWRADSLALADLANVTTHSDLKQSTARTDQGATLQPPQFLDADAAQPFPVIDFVTNEELVSTDSTLTSTFSRTGGANSIPEMTIFLVLEDTGSTSADYYFSFGNSSTNTPAFGIRNDLGDFSVFLRNDSNGVAIDADITTTTISTAGLCVLGFKIDIAASNPASTARWAGWLNGKEETNGTANLSGNNYTFDQVGFGGLARTGVASNATFNEYEVVVIDRALSDDEMRVASSWLMAYHGIE